MNTKILAVAVVAVLVVGGGAALYFSGALNKETDKEINLISQVNTEGTEIFIKSDLHVEDFVTFESGKFKEFKADGWRGKIFRTPGNVTIQHTMLRKIVEDLGLSFKLYIEGSATDNNSVYYIATPFNKTSWDDGKAHGGIIWQPVCEQIIKANTGVKAELLIKTSQFAPDHACCVIAANKSFTSNNSEATSAFLAAYVKANNWVNDLANREALITFAMEKTKQDREVVIAALDDVKYTMGNLDTPNTPLSTLKNDSANLVETYSNSQGILKKSLADLGFNGPNAYKDFANRFVQDQYLSKALKEPTTKVEGKTVTVCVIAGDIHQIALHVGKWQGFFEAHGVNVDIIEGGNGGAVATSLQNGSADIGLLGLPPITITTINSTLLKA